MDALCSSSATIKSAVISAETFAALAKPSTAAVALMLLEKGLPIDDALLDYVQEYGTLAVEHNVTHVGHGKDACNFVTMRFRKCTFGGSDRRSALFPSRIEIGNSFCDRGNETNEQFLASFCGRK